MLSAAVSGERVDRDAEDAFQVPDPGRFLMTHQFHAIFPAGLLQLFGHGRMDRSTVGVTADIVPGHGCDDIGTTTLLK